MRFWKWDGNVERALALLPFPLFRPRDAFTVAEQMGLQTYEGNRIWRTLVQQGRVVRTNHLIGRARARFFWERTT